ncbi:DUF4865 family protein [Pantoea latae]|uniref:DUF4865 domain-containing protein n=1 Tax=Pantoea latae TaxID=1964541 RepID=A0A1V9DQG8_9GAMM|nr:DUF4865 family protein [Pantoea latae]OQP36097.1 DUF4865 domain-containing protein [Pantoea latae]
MIVMHYGFTLPADYDMAIIERRIAQNGAKLDNFPDLLFKAYLYARRDEGAQANRYAPLYLWRDTAGLTRFLQSDGFARLVADFGWPQLHSGIALKVPTPETLRGACYARLRHQPLAPYSDLAALTPNAALVGWDLSGQSLLQADFSAHPPAAQGEIYRIGYLARGADYA